MHSNARKLGNDSRRSEQRSKPTKEHPVNVEIIGRPDIKITVLDISVGGLQLRVPQNELAPGLKLAEAVPLLIDFPSSGDDLNVVAEVVGRRDDDIWRTFNLRMKNDPKQSERLTKILEQMGNRRQTFRAKSSPDRDDRVRFSGAGDVEGRLHNLSFGGLAALVAADAEESLRQWKSVRIEINLAGQDEATILSGDIIDRALVDGHAFYRVRFADEQTSESERRLRESVMALQRISLQRQSSTGPQPPSQRPGRV